MTRGRVLGVVQGGGDPEQGAVAVPGAASPTGRAEPPLPSCSPHSLHPTPTQRTGSAARARRALPRPRSPSDISLGAPAVKEAAVQRKHNLYRDSMVMHNSDPNLHLLGEGVPIDWAEEHGGQPEAEPATEKRRRAKQVVSVIQDDEGVLPYEVGAEMLLQPGSPKPDPGAPPSSPDGVEKIQEALAKESLGDEVEEQLTNGTDATRESSATKEVAVAGAVPGDVPCQGPASQGDGVHCTALASPAPGAGVLSEAVVQHVAPASPVPASPVPRADAPSEASVQHAAPPSPKPRARVPSGARVPHAAPGSPVPGADVPLEASVQHATAASPKPRADVPPGASVQHATPPSPAPRASVPSGAGVQHAAPASPAPRADLPSGAEVPHTTPAPPAPRADVPSEAGLSHATPASPAPGAETPSPSAGSACHQPSDKETGEVSPPGSECCSPQLTGTTESGEGVQTEF